MKILRKLSLCSTLLLLTGCSIQFLKEEVSNSASSSSSEAATSYISAVSIPTGDSLTSTNVTFTYEEATQGADLVVGEEGSDGRSTVMSYVSQPSNIITGVTDLKNVAMINGGIKVGHLRSYEEGSITFSFDRDVKYVKVMARPYVSESVSATETTYTIEQDCALAANSETEFIKINTDFATKNLITDTACSYKLGDSGTNTLKLIAAPGRIVITQISLYY